MTDNNSSNAFRCPFQIKGEKEGTIIEVTLDENRESRFKLISAAYKTFHENTNLISIRFSMPASLLESCDSLEGLKAYIVPYQAEILGVEIDYRLNPFLPYQLVHHTRESIQPLYEKTPYKFATANYLSKVVNGHGFELNKMEDITSWIEFTILQAMMEGAKSPGLMIEDENHITFLTIAPGSITLHPEEHEEITGPGNNNKNCFGIVLNPFYPKEFARYSENIQIVLSRMKDFFSISLEQRQKIRYKANLVYKEHGVKIKNLLEDQQPAGVWIPEYI